MSVESALCNEELFPSFLFLLYLLFRLKQLQYLVSFWSECVRTGSWLVSRGLGDSHDVV